MAVARDVAALLAEASAEGQVRVETEARRLVVRGFADSRPLTADETPEGRARNRRVEITINLAEAPRAAEAVNRQQPSGR